MSGKFNPSKQSHRGRVVGTRTLKYQLDQAKAQATKKLDHLLGTITTGTTAIGNVTIKDGVVTNVNITNHGSGYTSATASISGSGSGAVVTVEIGLDGSVKSLTIVNGGEGYSTTPGDTIVTISGDGISAKTNLIAKDGVITNVNITEKGSNYKFPPLVTFSSSSGNGASAIVVLDSEESVSNVTITNGGEGYVIPVSVEFTSPSAQPVLSQRTLIYDIYYKEFIDGIKKPISILPAKFNKGQLVQAKKTMSLSTITNPGDNLSNSDIRVKAPPAIEENPESPVKGSPFITIRNDGKDPSQEYLYTHNKRIKRNSGLGYLLQKARNKVAEKVEDIRATGGRGALLSADTISSGRLQSINIDNDGLYYIPAKSTINIKRTNNDPNKAQAVPTVDGNGTITSVKILNPTTNTGYTDTHLPTVSISSDSGSGAVLEVRASDIAGGRIITVTIVNGGTGYDRTITLPVISIDRITNDPGLAKVVVSTVTEGNVMNHGAITSVTVTNSGSNSGYSSSYPPIVTVSSTEGSVSDVQSASFLDLYLDGAFDNFTPKWGEKAPGITSTLNTKGSTSMIKHDRDLNIVDVNDPNLLRKQRLDYKNSDIIRDAKAKEAALSRFNKVYPGQTAIPGPPVLPVITISSTTGSDALLKPVISWDGKLVGIEILNPGSGYPDSPATVTITGGGIDAFGALASPVIEGGTITDITVIFEGQDYTEVPTVTIAGGGGEDAEATATVTDFKVTDYTVTDNGSNYVSVVITGGGGSGAKALCHTDNGFVVGFQIIDVGSGYNTQQPPDPRYLAFLKEAEYVKPVVVKEEFNLPEPTLYDSRDRKNFLDNQSVDNRNAQLSAARRAASSVIEIAQVERKNSQTTWLYYQANVSNANLKIAFDAINTASKAIVAAKNLKNYRPPPKDPYMAHKNKVYALYRASIPAWDTNNEYVRGDLVNYSVNDIIYMVTQPHTPAIYPSTIPVNPVTYLGKLYKLNPIIPR